MIINNTCVQGNDTVPCVSSGSPAGLAAGLTLFFLLLAIVVGIMVYKYHGKIRRMMQFGQSRSQKNEDYTETPQAVCHQYTSVSREQSLGQNPIYENLSAQPAEYNRHAVNQSRVCSEPEEELYLRCDSPDDAIYNNDPMCNLSIIADLQEEDVYIVPDS